MYSGKRDDRPVTVSRLRRMKTERTPIACLTAYDFSLARAVDQAGVDVILVGDSLGMVMQGRASTTAVTTDDLVYHSRCVEAARARSLLMVDMPFLGYTDPVRALATAERLMKEGGAQMVKLEGGAEHAAVVAALARAGVPVCGHLGLRPQMIHKIGGYRVQGRDPETASAMLEDARCLAAAGADVLLVECVPAALGARLAAAVDVPVIGIGAGPDCDGQILVIQDILGITPGRAPSFAHDFLADTGSVAGAIEAYVNAVRGHHFPATEHSFT